MPARSIGTATISFGLVSVPVNLYSSSESKASVSFNMLHKKCGIAPQAAVHLPEGQRGRHPRGTVKGYEFAKDQYVVLDARGAQGARGEGDGHDRRRRVRPARQGRSRVPREGLLPRPRQGRRPRVSSARRGAAGDRTRRARPVRGARPAAPRAPPSAQRRARDGAAPLRRRSAPDDRSAPFPPAT